MPTLALKGRNDYSALVQVPATGGDALLVQFDADHNWRVVHLGLDESGVASTSLVKISMSEKAGGLGSPGTGDPNPAVFTQVEGQIFLNDPAIGTPHSYFDVNRGIQEIKLSSASGIVLCNIYRLPTGYSQF